MKRNEIQNARAFLCDFFFFFSSFCSSSSDCPAVGTYVTGVPAAAELPSAPVSAGEPELCRYLQWFPPPRFQPAKSPLQFQPQLVRLQQETVLHRYPQRHPPPRFQPAKSPLQFQPQLVRLQQRSGLLRQRLLPGRRQRQSLRLRPKHPLRLCPKHLLRLRPKHLSRLRPKHLLRHRSRQLPKECPELRQEPHPFGHR